MPRMDIRAQFGIGLQRLRRAHGLSQEALAADTEIDRAYVGRLERGEANPTLLLLGRIASRLEVPIAELLGEIRLDVEGALPALKPSRRRRGDPAP
jgi:transcriptional regulator with XRE-family HTH domain